MQRVARGESEAVAALYDRYSGLVWSIARRILRDAERSEEATQQVFTRLWQTASRFDPERGVLDAWVGTIAHRCCIDLLRSERRQPQVLADGGEILAATLPAREDTEAEAIARVDGRVVRDALASLPERQREALELAYFGGYSQSEVAEQLEVPLGTVKTRMFHGLGRMRELLSMEARRGVTG